MNKTIDDVLQSIYARHDAEVLKLTEERDEARRKVSELKANEASRLASAVRLKGWICFEETL